jgi:hypothetical protein
MKKTLLVALGMASASGAFAQGTINWNDHSAGTLEIQIYSPNPASPGVAQTGNSAGDTPSGSTVYGGVPIGGNATDSGATGYGNGNNFTAQLYAAPGTVASFSSLTAVPQYTANFFTVAAGTGYFKGPAISGDPGVPGVAAGSTATLALAAWYNGGGAFTSYAAAVAGNVPSGTSTLWQESLGGPPNTPPFLTGLTSFSLTTTSAPEPSTIALGVMGASAFLLRRRMSK